MILPEATKEMKTPQGEVTVKVKGYLTAIDHRNHRRFFIDLAGDGKQNADTIDKAEDALLKLALIEVNGSADVLTEVMKLTKKDYEFVVKLATDLVSGAEDEEGKKKEKTSGGNTGTSSEEGK